MSNARDDISSRLDVLDPGTPSDQWAENVLTNAGSGTNAGTGAGTTGNHTNPASSAGYRSIGNPVGDSVDAAAERISHRPGNDVTGDAASDRAAVGVLPPRSSEMGTTLGSGAVGGNAGASYLGSDSYDRDVQGGWGTQGGKTGSGNAGGYGGGFDRSANNTGGGGAGSYDTTAGEPGNVSTGMSQKTRDALETTDPSSTSTSNILSSEPKQSSTGQPIVDPLSHRSENTNEGQTSFARSGHGRLGPNAGAGGGAGNDGSERTGTYGGATSGDSGAGGGYASANPFSDSARVGGGGGGGAGYDSGSAAVGAAAFGTGAGALQGSERAAKDDYGAGGKSFTGKDSSGTRTGDYGSGNFGSSAMSATSGAASGASAGTGSGWTAGAGTGGSGTTGQTDNPGSASGAYSQDVSTVNTADVIGPEPKWKKAQDLQATSGGDDVLPPAGIDTTTASGAISSEPSARTRAALSSDPSNQTTHSVLGSQPKQSSAGEPIVQPLSVGDDQAQRGFGVAQQGGQGGQGYGSSGETGTSAAMGMGAGYQGKNTGEGFEGAGAQSIGAPGINTEPSARTRAALGGNNY